MKKIFLLASAVALLFVLPACEVEGDSLLDKQESGDLNEDIVFSEAVLTWRFLNNIYFEIPFGYDHTPNEYVWIDGITDDGMHRLLNAWSKDVYLGAFGPTNIPSRIQRWQKCYSSIRAANKFMDRIDDVPLDATYINNEERRSQMKHEARLLRALFYAELLKWYGGVPIITEVLEMDSPELYTPRANLQEMRDFIFSELDAASAGLPESWADGDKPRVTPSVAEVIKARVLLQLASPLFNNDKDAFGNPTELCPWSWGNYSAERWKEASDAAKKFMDKGIHALHVSTGSRLSSTELKRIGTLATRESYGFYEYDITLNNKQMIMWYPKKKNATNETTKICVPHTMHNQANSGGTIPTWNFAATFSTINGVQIYETNEDGSYKTGSDGMPVVTARALADGFDPQNPYVDRDNRFYHSIYYNGLKYSNGVEYEIWRSPADGTYGREYNPTFNHTGFFLRRHNDPFKIYPPSNRTSGISGSTTNAFPLFHYSEVLLVYAEALNEYLPDGASRTDVVNVMNEFRDRADMPKVAPTFEANGWNVNSKQDMRAFIRNERRIELAFELHRAHDVRRWLVGETTQRLIYGQDVIKDKTNNTYTYSVEIAQRRAFEKKHYLWPIPHAEIANNPNMVQNPGWGALE